MPHCTVLHSNLLKIPDFKVETRAAEQSLNEVKPKEFPLILSLRPPGNSLRQEGFRLCYGLC